MKPCIFIHIETLNFHTASPGVLLQADECRPTEQARVREALRGVIVPPNIVLDQATGLMWSQATIAKGKTWAEAKEAATAVRLGGYSDWRLPTRKELLTLVDDTRSDPAIDTEKFECESGWYWTSTPLASSPSVCAWGVYFSDGGAGYYRQGGSGRVRAVRSVLPASPGQ